MDAKHKLIVEQAVSNQVLDVGLLAQTAQAAKEALGVDQIDAVADRGYYKVEDIEACEKAGIVPFPRPQRGAAVREGLFRKDEPLRCDQRYLSVSGRAASRTPLSAYGRKKPDEG